MPLPKNAQNDKARIDDRRARAAAMHLEGKSQQAIAAVVGVSQMTVSKDLAAVRAAWRASAFRDFDQLRAEELARLAHVEFEAWRGWRRRMMPSPTSVGLSGCRLGGRRAVRESRPPAGTRAPVVTLRTVEETTSRTQAGDPGFLEVVLRCVEARMKLLGLGDVSPVGQLAQPHLTSRSEAGRGCRVDAGWEAE